MDKQSNQAINAENYQGLVSCYRDHLTEQGGFLPSFVPGGSIFPESFNLYIETVRELPLFFAPYSQKSTREWLNTVFSDYQYDSVLACLETLDRVQLTEFLTIISILMQTYRWDQLPAKAETFSDRQVDFPAALCKPWQKASDLLGLPYANTYWAVIGSNWSIKNMRGGESYSNVDLQPEQLKLLYSWLPEPYSQELEEFILAFVEVEARGAVAIESVMKALEHIVNRQTDKLLSELAVLNEAILAMGSAFNQRIQKKRIDPKHWRDFVHVPFAWGLDDKAGRRLEGASGMQVGAIAALNAFFVIPDHSNIGQATIKSRAYLLPGQKTFLEQLEQFSGIVQQYIRTENNPVLTKTFNRCLMGLLRWRASHQNKGAMYLKANDGDDTPQIATGLTLPEGEEVTSIAEVFVEDMQDRMTETKSVII